MVDGARTMERQIHRDSKLARGASGGKGETTVIIDAVAFLTEIWQDPFH